MDRHPISDLMANTMQKIREMIDTDTIIGEAITVGDVTIVPISRVTFGFASGGGDGTLKEHRGFGGGGGAGVKIDPIGFLVVKDGNARMLNIAPPAGTTIDRLVELVPDVLDRVEEFIDKRRNG